MNKKKLGQIAIILALVIFISYPAISQKVNQARVSSLMVKGDHAKAYTILKQMEVDILSEEQVYLTICKLFLEMEVDLTPTINTLIKNQNDELLQKLVDLGGVNLGHNLVTLYEYGGIELSEDARSVIAINYAARQNYEKAMEA